MTKDEAETSSPSPLRILMVAAEAAPFAKVGGLGDVVGSLPRRLVEGGCEVAVVLPLYREVLLGGHDLQPTGRQAELIHGGVRRSSPVFERINGGVRYWFIQEDSLYDRQAVYGPPGGEYSDSAERFSYLGRAALEAALLMDYTPDVVHCHDWHSALTHLYMESTEGTEWIREAGKVLTVHNLAYQGVFEPGVLGSLDLPRDALRERILDPGGSVNFLMAGIRSADLVTTVSPTYAREIQSPEMGCGLDGILRGLGDRLIGILNGIDYDAWDPAGDPCLAMPFSGKDVSGRQENRVSIRNLLGLEPDARAPLLAFVGRLVDQKGADLLASALPRIVEENFQVVVLGAGDPGLEASLQEVSMPLAGRVSVNIGFDESMARRIYAGSDFFLMPSRFEPCGLGQMIAMRYGAVPIVRATGGLIDTVKDLEETVDGNGLVFREAHERDMLAAIRRAGELFRNGRLGEVVPRILSLDNSWRRSAKRYAQVYRKVLAGERK